MKLRLGEGIVRFRVSDREVRRLLEEGRLEERLPAGPSGEPFAWALEVAAGRREADGGRAVEADLDLRLDAGGLTVLIPRSAARRWADSPALGLGAERPLADGGRLRVLVEKDLPCRHPAAGSGPGADAGRDPGARGRGRGRTALLATLRRGVEAALAASVPQVLVAKLEEKLLLPPGETADIGPRFVEELARKARKRLPEDEKWLAASAFHFGYAASWGAAYALLYERRPVRPVLGGLALGGFIWSITFPHWGGAVLTGSEPHPRERSWRMELVRASAALTFGLGTALLYGRGPDGDAADA